MDTQKLILELCSAHGISGREEKAADKIAEILADIKGIYDIHKDINGNLHACMGTNETKTILLDAHIDQIGMVVTKIDEKGFLKVSPVGGMDMRIINDTLFTVHGKEDVKAVVCCLPPHLSDGNEDTAVSKDKVYLDTGMSCERVKELVEIGDGVTFAQQGFALCDGRIASPALDDRCCAAVLIKCAELLSEKELDCKVHFLFSSKEEVGGIGAKTGAFSIKPDRAIAFDVSFAKQPGVADCDSGEMSKGPMIGISPTLSRDMTNELKLIAKNNNIEYQTEIMGGTTGTNADDISANAGGIKTALISVPLRNMHTPAEIIDVNDIENSALLAAKYILQIK
ncbi:MAG: M28 family peptidase [Clostridiales bacterium]|nr:M28 family peptidase [Clostridiales bacterium]